MKKCIFLSFLLLIPGLCVLAQKPGAKIFGDLPFVRNGDTVKVTVLELGGFNNENSLLSDYYSRAVGHRFEFSLPVSAGPRYIAVTFYTPNSLEKQRNIYLIENGDKVDWKERNGEYVFSGPHSTKYNAAEHLANIFSASYVYYDHDPAAYFRCLASEDTTITRQLKYLDSVKNALSPEAYTLMVDNILSHKLFRGVFAAQPSDLPEIGNLRAMIEQYKLSPAIERRYDETISDTLAIINTQFFPRGIMTRYKMDSCYLAGKKFEPLNYYKFIKRNYQGIVRDALITWMIYDRRKSSDQIPALIRDALTFVKDQRLRQVLIDAGAAIKGGEAKDFQLTDERGVKRNFSEFRGKVILLDFWYTGCPSCAQTTPFLRATEAKFQDKPVIFISICTDKNRALWLSSLKGKLYTGSYGINLFTDGLGVHHPLLLNYNVNAFPGLILIAKDGRIAGAVPDPRQDNSKGLEDLIDDILKSK